jgi:hypothetical protein
VPARQAHTLPALPEERLDRLKEVFTEVRRALGVPWVGELFETLAVYDRYLVAAWLQLLPSVMSAYFDRIAGEIAARATASIAATGMPFSDHGSAASAAWSGEALRELERTLDALEQLNPSLLLIATAVRDALLGRDVGSCPPRTGPDALPRSIGSAPERSLRWTVGEASDLAGPFGSHLPSKQYRLLALWPGYLDLMRRELRPLGRSEVYRRSLVELDTFATAAVRALPFPFRANGELGRSLGYTPSEVGELLDLVTTLQRRYCELALHAAAQRIAWQGGNLGAES